MSNWVVLAHIARPRGIRGEVVADTGPWSSEQLLGFPRLFLQPSGREVKLEAARPQQDRMLLKFEGIDSVEAAETFRDAELCIPQEDRPPAQDGEIYHSDLIGCRVFEKATGAELGVVTDCLEYGGPMLLEVKSGTAEILIPFVSAICQEIDMTAKRIAVELPEGLKDL